MRTIFFIAIRHLVSRRRQTIVAVMGMALSVTVLVGMTGLLLGFEHKFLGETLKISPHVIITEEELEPPAAVADRAWGARALLRLWHERPAERPQHIKRPRALLHAGLDLP